MDALKVSISLDTIAVRSTLAKFYELASRLGREEAERRIGCPIDATYFERLTMIVEAGGSRTSVHFRMIPSAEFDRAMAALAGSSALLRAIAFT